MVSKAALAVAGILALVAVIGVAVAMAKKISYNITPRTGAEGRSVFQATGVAVPNKIVFWEVFNPTSEMWVALRQTTTDADGNYFTQFTAPISFFGVGTWQTRVEQIIDTQHYVSEVITIKVVPFR